MLKEQHYLDLLEDIYSAFPNVGLVLDDELIDREFELSEKQHAWTFLLMRFSQLTTDAIAIKDKITAEKYLLFMNKKLNDSNSEIIEAIEIYFVADLMWNIKDEEIKKWGWKLIPSELKSLYISYSKKLEE